MGGLTSLATWLWSEGTGAVSDAFQGIMNGIVRWVTDAVVWVISAVFRFFLDASDPNVQADWFVAGDGPYQSTLRIGAVLLVGFVLAGITQGVLMGDVQGMMRRIVLDLPISVLGMVGLVGVVQLSIRVTDELSSWVLQSFEDDLEDFSAVVGTIAYLTPGLSAMFVVFVLAIVAVLAGLVLIAELAVRSALIYVTVALAPLVFAARLWPALEGTAKRLLQLLFGLILSKLVMAVALAVAAAAAVGVGSGGEVTALPEPEVAAEDPEGSVTQAVGILMAAIAAFGVAAFSPLIAVKLLPITEAALVAQGVRGGPVRGAQQALWAAHSADYLRSKVRRLGGGGGARGGGSAGPSGPGAGGPTPAGPRGGGARGGGGVSGAGASAGSVGAGVGPAAKAGKDAVRKGADQVKKAAGGDEPGTPSEQRRPSGGSGRRAGGTEERSARSSWRPVPNSGPQEQPHGKEVPNKPDTDGPPVKAQPAPAQRRRSPAKEAQKRGR